MLIKRNQQEFTRKLQTEMAKDKLDALILTSADAIYYATGYASSFLYRAGRAGLTVAVFTKEGTISLVLSEFEKQAAASVAQESGIHLETYPTWIYIEDYAKEGMVKDVQPDLNKTYRLAAQFVPEVNGKARIGVEPSTLPHSAWQYLSETFGEKNLVDAKNVLNEARTIKTAWEIEVLRRAAHYAELAMNKTARQVVPGMTDAEVIWLFKVISQEQSVDVLSISNAHTIGANFAPAHIPSNTRISRGDVIRLDGGPNVLGYNSDIARTFAVGGVTEKRREEIYAHLWSGYEFAVNHIGPGVKMSDVFNGIHKTLNERGFNGYIRGHQGHSLGCSLFSEEYPFIGPEEHRVFEPGMVFCLEMPYYSSKNHSFNIEDTFLVTNTGIELFTRANPSLYL